MLLDLLYATLAQSFISFSLQTLIDKVRGLYRPTFRQIVSLDADLFGKDAVPDFFSALAQVRPLAHHQLIANDTNSEVVCDKGMILAAHYFRSHVPWSARSV